MAQLVKFDPDPESPGLGLAHFDDDSSLYTSLDALGSAGALPPNLQGPDQRLAGPGAPPIDWNAFNAARASDAAAGADDRAVQPPPPTPGGFGPPSAARAEFNALPTPQRGALPPPDAARQAAIESTAGNPNLPPAARYTGPAAGSVDAQVQHALSNPVTADQPPGAPQHAGPAPLPVIDQTTGAPGAPGGTGQSPEQEAYARLMGAPVTTPGVNPEAMIRNGVMVPTGGRAVTDMGAPYSPAEAQVRELANQKVVEAHIATAESQAARAQATQMAAEAAMPALQQQAIKNAKDLDTIKAQYQRERAQLQSEVDDFDRTAKVDPDRFFAKRGAWSQIGSIIGQALGAFAATRSGSPNWAQQAIDSEINRDIAAQNENLHQGRLGQQSALARLADRYGDVQQAEAALRLSQQQIADKQILSFGAASQRDDIMNAAREWVANNQQQRAQQELDFYHASVGKTQQTQEMKFLQPQAGGARPPTAQELANRAEALGKVEHFRRYAEGQESMSGKPVTNGADASAVRAYGQQQAAIAQAETDARNAIDAVGLQIRPDGSIQKPKEWDAPGLHWYSGAVNWAKPENRAALEAIHTAAVSHAKLQGSRLTPQTIDDFEHHMKGQRAEDIAAGLGRMWSAIEAKKRAVDASFSPTVKEAYRTNRGYDAARANQGLPGGNVGIAGGPVPIEQPEPELAEPVEEQP